MIHWPDHTPDSGSITPDGRILSAPGRSHESMVKSAGYRHLAAFLRAGGIRYRIDSGNLSVQTGRKGRAIAADLVDMLRPTGRVNIDVNETEGSQYSAGALETGWGCDWEDALARLRKRGRQ